MELFLRIDGIAQMSSPNDCLLILSYRLSYKNGIPNL